MFLRARGPPLPLLDVTGARNARSARGAYTPTTAVTDLLKKDGGAGQTAFSVQVVEVPTAEPDRIERGSGNGTGNI